MMIWITKLGDRVKIMRIGEPDQDTPSSTVLGINLDSDDRDLLGKKLLETYKITDFVAIEGSFVFPLE